MDKPKAKVTIPAAVCDELAKRYGEGWSVAPVLSIATEREPHWPYTIPFDLAVEKGE